MRPPTGGGSPTSIPWSKSYTGKTDYAASRRAHGLVVQRWDAEQINIRHPLQEFCSTENTPKNSFIKKKKKKARNLPLSLTQYIQSYVQKPNIAMRRGCREKWFRKDNFLVGVNLELGSRGGDG